MLIKIDIPAEETSNEWIALEGKLLFSDPTLNGLTWVSFGNQLLLTTIL